MSAPDPVPTADVSAAPEVLESSPGFLHRLARRPGVWIALGWILLVVLGSFFAPLLAPYNPLEQNLSNVFGTPSGSNWLGTDSLGRDILSRLMYGGPLSLMGAAEAVLVALIIGVPLGMLAGYKGGPVDSLISRAAEIIQALPVIIVLLAVVAVYGREFTISMGALGVLLSASFIRLARATTAAVRHELFVDAARVSGLSHLRIVARHILPNITAPLLIQSTLTLGTALLVQAGLGFLGLGPQPPEPNWGAGIAEAFKYINNSKWLMVPTGAVLILTVLAFNFLGDALRDASALGGTSVTRRKTKKVKRSPAVPVKDDGSLLRIDGLRVEYPSKFGSYDTPKTVVQGVDLRVDRGEIVGLVGESGSGKSQTAFAVLGLLPPGGRVRSGDIIFDGVNLLDLSERQMREYRGARIAYIPQEPMSNLDPSFTIGSQLVESLRANIKMSKAQAKERSLKLLARVGIPDPERTFRSFPHEVSGGMAQRVLIARAVSCEPDLLIADEPTTALDVTVQAEVLDLLRDLQKEREMGVILVTHNFGVVADLCDRVAVMQSGQIVENRPAHDLFGDPEHPYTKMLLGSTLEDSTPPVYPGDAQAESRAPEAELESIGGVTLRKGEV